MKVSALAVVLFVFFGVADAQQPSEPLTPIGAAVVDITPGFPIRLNGYGSRKAESEGVESRLKARALAIGGDVEGPAVLVAVDNCGVPARVTDEVAARLERRNGLRRERFVVSSSHTHAGPCLSNGIPFIFGAKMPPEQEAHIDRYTAELTD